MASSPIDDGAGTSLVRLARGRRGQSGRLVHAVARMGKHGAQRSDTEDLVSLLNREVLKGGIPAGAAVPHDDGQRAAREASRSLGHTG